jgi:hypothetical protein
MQTYIHRKSSLAALAFILAACFAAPASAQFQNPIQAAKDAWNKAKQPAAAPKPAPAPAPGPAPTDTTGQPAASTPAAGAPAQPASTSAAPGTPAGDSSQVWTPPSSDTSTTGKVAAPAGPINPAKLPDVAGIHLGVTSAEVTPILQKLHPGAPLQLQSNGQGNPPSGILVSVGTAIPQSADAIKADYTYEPNKPQTVYFIARNVTYEQPIVRENLVDALRQKYGKETNTIMANGGVSVMWWLFDEQGNIIHTTNFDSAGAPFGCQGDYAESDGVNLYRNLISDDFHNGLAAATYCDSVIILHVTIDASATVKNTRTILLDRALMRRSAVAVGEGQKAAAKKQQQEEMQKANQAKPSL